MEMMASDKWRFETDPNGGLVMINSVRPAAYACDWQLPREDREIRFTKEETDKLREFLTKDQQ